MTKQNQGIFDVKRKEYHIAIIVLCLAMLMFFFCFTANATDEDTTTEKNEVTTETTTPERATTEDSGHAEEIETANNNEVVSDENREVDSNGSVAEDENKQVETAPAIVGTWKSESGGWRFYNSAGVMQKGLFTIDGKKYYLGPDGIMKTGWQQIGSHYYYFGSDGSMRTGWLSARSTWYYLHSDGSMAFGLEEVEKLLYFFGASNDGAMKTGWHKVSDAYYYFGSSGAAAKGWQYIGGYWYYFNQLAIMQTGLQNITGKTYYFGSINDGSMKAGWQQVNGRYYYFGASNDGAAKTSWQYIGGYWYYFNQKGVMEYGLQTIEGSLYYLGNANDGSMKTGWQQVENKWYYFNSSGAALKSWQYIGGYWYYFDNDNIMIKNIIREIDGNKYAFNSDGVMMTGTFEFQGKLLTANSSGAIKIGGWVNYNGIWYFQLENGEFIKNTIKTIDGSNYIFDESGAMQSGLVTFEGKSYVTSAAGAVMRNAWAKVSSYWYYAQDNMEIYKNTMAKIGNSEYGFNESGAMYLGRFAMNEKTYITDANGVAIGYDDSAESKAREVAASLNYDLYKAFYYCANMSRYYLTSNGRTSGPIMSSADYAKYGYKNRGGDCIVMASSFKYLAQACGYSATQWFGWVGSSTHSWCEIGGYIYDPNFTNATNRSGYGLTYGQKGTWKYRKSYTM